MLTTAHFTAGLTKYSPLWFSEISSRDDQRLVPSSWFSLFSCLIVRIHTFISFHSFDRTLFLFAPFIWHCFGDGARFQKSEIKCNRISSSSFPCDNFGVGFFKARRFNILSHLREETHDLVYTIAATTTVVGDGIIHALSLLYILIIKY